MYPQVLASALRAPSAPPTVPKASSRSSSFLLIVRLLSLLTGALGAGDVAVGERTAEVTAVRVRAEAIGRLRRPRLEQEGARSRQQRKSQKGQFSSHDVLLQKQRGFHQPPSSKVPGGRRRGRLPPRGHRPEEEGGGSLRRSG